MRRMLVIGGGLLWVLLLGGVGGGVPLLEAQGPLLQLHRRDPRVHPDLNPLVTPGIHPFLTPGINPNLNPQLNPLVNPRAPVDLLYTPDGEFTGLYGVSNGRGGRNYFDVQGRWRGFSPSPDP